MNDLSYLRVGKVCDFGGDSYSIEYKKVRKAIPTPEQKKRENQLKPTYAVEPDDLLTALIEQTQSSIEDLCVLEEISEGEIENSAENFPLFDNWSSYEMMSSCPYENLQEMFPERIIKEAETLLDQWNRIVERHEKNILGISQDPDTVEIYEDKLDLDSEMILHLEHRLLPKD